MTNKSKQSEIQWRPNQNNKIQWRTNETWKYPKTKETKQRKNPNGENLVTSETKQIVTNVIVSVER